MSNYFLTKFTKNNFLRFVLLCFLSLQVIFFLCEGQVYSGQAILSWEAPTTYENGTPLTDLAGYKIYYGTTTGNYTQNIDVGNVTTYTFSNLINGSTYFFVATAYNTARIESNYTNEVSKNIPSAQLNILTITKAGTCTGTVTSSLAGISCGADCSEAYTPGTVVTLSATADGSSTFGGWTGACTGTGSCSVTMDAAKTVTAIFTLKTYTITASAGSGGSITPSGAVIVNHGASRSFTISPNTNYTVSGVLVDGSSVGAVSTYNFTNLTSAHTISASFAAVEENLPPDTIDLPKTGQTISYAMGDDGSIEAGIEWPTARFTDNGDGTVTDNLTGLMWLKDGACFRKNWSTALSTIKDFKSNPRKYTCLGYTSSYNDWRLPNANELESLVNYGTSDTSKWLNTQGFVNMKSSSYWSSTTYQAGTSQSWVISMNNGLGSQSGKSNTLYFLPVRYTDSSNSPEVSKTGQTMSYAQGDDGSIHAGADWPAPRFADNGDGTATDNLTGLMWLKDGGCFRKSWSTIFNTIKDFNINPEFYNCLGYTASHTDWRLPNVKELESLVNYGVADSAIWLNSQGFVNTKSYSYWASTTYQGSTNQAWMVDMQRAKRSFMGKSYTYYAWPVRGGAVGGN
jgi:hypothetical protein